MLHGTGRDAAGTRRLRCGPCLPWWLWFGLGATFAATACRRAPSAPESEQAVAAATVDGRRAETPAPPEGEAVPASTSGDAAAATADWVARQELTLAGPPGSSVFSSAVVLQGDTLLAGGSFSPGAEEPTHVAAFYRRAHDTWTLAQEVRGEDDLPIGYGLALDGDTALVDRFVFERTDGVWRRTVRLTSADGRELLDEAALSADVAMVGFVPGDDPAVRGAVAVFERSGSAWPQVQVLESPGEALDGFGESVALCGDAALISARRDADGGIEAGAVYVFARRDGRWTLQGKLRAGDAKPHRQLGLRAAFDGDTAAFAAVGDHAFAGLVYLFQRSGGEWSQAARLGDPDVTTEFGRVLDADRDAVLIGAPRDVVARDGSHTGAAYLYTHGPAGWAQASRFVPPGGGGGGRGFSATFDDRTVVLALPREGRVALQFFEHADVP